MSRRAMRFRAQFWLSLGVLMCLLGRPGVVWARDNDRRYHVGQSLVWSGVGMLPVGAVVLAAGVGTGDGQIAPRSTAMTVAGAEILVSAPLAMGVGAHIASGALANERRWQPGPGRSAGKTALIMNYAAFGIATLDRVLFWDGYTALYIAAGISTLSIGPAIIQYSANRRCYRRVQEDFDREMREIDEELLQIEITPVLTPEGSGLAVGMRF